MFWALVVAHLVELSIPTPNTLGLIPIISHFYTSR